MSEDERGATINVWCEPTGYWTGSVVVSIPGLDNWKAYATSFHDIGEAIDWARHQVDMAVA